ncbi:MAG TPA: hypothetical protein VLD67_14690, partial [Vicinamibacterales bacterium]|nr:hypothetical protein [Vicinamibacterales bacterium]
MPRYLLLILLAVASSACNESGDFVPTAPGGPVIPSIGGTYASTTMWHFELTTESGVVTFICAGTLTIGTQVGATFSGTYEVRDSSCGVFGGTVISGTFAEGGAITFGLTLFDQNLLW